MGSVIRVLVGLTCLILLNGQVYGQRFKEIFRQKKTQEEYLLKQIGYLELYGGYVRQGYEILGSGLAVIKGFTGKEFDLHEEFFGSLKSVNPVIKNDARVAEIVAMNELILKVFDGMGTVALSRENLARFALVHCGVMKECEKDLDELRLLLSADALEMSDEQRLSRLTKIYSSMSEKRSFSLGLFERVLLFSKLKNKEELELKNLRRWYESN